MRKIAIDCTHFIEGKVGGFQSYLLNLLDGIFLLGTFGITLFILKGQEEHFLKYDSQFTLKLVSINNVYKRIAWQNLIFPFLSICYDVILFPANFRPLLAFCKTVTVIHDLQYIYHPQYWSVSRLLYRKIFIYHSIKYSNRIIAISESVKSEIIQNFNRVDTVVIYNAIRRFVYSDNRISIKLPEKFFLVPSSLYPHKNIINLLQAIIKLEELDNAPHFIFVGPFNSFDFYKEYHSPQNILLGYVDVKVLEYLYLCCSCVVLPSVYEGFGMPYAEALFSQKPIVACDIPIAREILNEGAEYIMSPFDDIQILTALKKVINKGIFINIPKSFELLKIKTDPLYVAKEYMNALS